MKNLEKLRTEYDSKNVATSIGMFREQCESGWKAGCALVVSETYKDISNIVVFGMGGSALPAWILASFNLHTKPLEVWNKYGAPKHIGTNTLAIVMSYSGTTEETLEGARLAIDADAKVLAITVGGTLEKICAEKNIPLCKIDESTNPCGQPRFGVGFTMCALAGILSNLGFLKENDFEGAFSSLVAKKTLNDEDEEALLAKKMLTKIPVIVGAEHLAQVAHFFQNQLNETGKTFAIYHELPEVNHHLLESLSHPEGNKDNLIFVFFTSPFYNERNQKRFAIMRELVEKAGIATVSFSRSAASWSEEAFLFLESAEFTSYYLGLYNECDPSDIPFVIHFKKELGK